MLQKITTILLVLIILLPCYAFAAKPKVKTLCVNNAGEILVKAKCKKNETVFSIAALKQSISDSGKVVGIKGAPGTTGPTGQQGEQGPQGAQGPAGTPGAAGVKGPKSVIDFSGCRQVTSGPRLNFDGSFNVIPVVSATASCDPNNEFIFADSFAQASFNVAGNIAVVKTRSNDTFAAAGDTREYEVTYTAERITNVGQGLYTLEVSAICCPR